MSKKIIILFFLFFSLLSYKVIASDADQVNTDSEDFETTTIEDEIYDPFEPVNRAIFSFNNVADRIVLEPIAKGYKKLPSPLQSGINNFLSNLRAPLVVVNQLLQGQGENAVQSSGRFIVNSTVGVFGLFDVAEKIGLHKKENKVTILQSNRWEELLKTRIQHGVDNGLTEEFMNKVLKAIHQESINRQTKVMNK